MRFALLLAILTAAFAALLLGVSRPREAVRRPAPARTRPRPRRRIAPELTAAAEAERWYDEV